MTALHMIGEQARTSEIPAVATYDALSRAERYIHKTRDRALLALLARCNVSLHQSRILELGCGSGSFLHSLLAYGVKRAQATGIDAAERSARQSRAATDVSTAVADGALLPYRRDAFDVVFMFTSLSSMGDIEVRRHTAHEAMRVLRSGGLAVVYDFWTNPFNAAVVPVSATELHQLFEPYHVEVERVTLAPPLVRMLGGRRALCEPLERAWFLHTHLLASIVKGPQRD